MIQAMKAYFQKWRRQSEHLPNTFCLPSLGDVHVFFILYTISSRKYKSWQKLNPIPIVGGQLLYFFFISFICGFSAAWRYQRIKVAAERFLIPTDVLEIEFLSRN